MEDEVKFCLGTRIHKNERKVFEGTYLIHGKDEETLTKFTCLGLPLKNCKDLYASLDSFTQGLEDTGAKKRSFKDLPSVLQIKIARFECDTKVKINTTFEYPYQLDLDRDNGRYLTTDAKKNSPNLYTLSSVIGHSGGGVEDGSFFAIIRPTTNKNIWLKLDDGNLLTRVDIRRATDELFGGGDKEVPPFKIQKGTNAILLIYVRDDGNAKMLFNIDDKFLTTHVNPKETEVHEALLMIINVCLDSDLEKSCTFKIKKEATLESFKDILAEYYGVEEHRLRFYTSDTPSSLVLGRSYSDTVEHVLKSGTLLIKFDTKPGVTGVCDLCPKRNLEDALDMEEYGREQSVNKPPVSKASAKVTTRRKK